MTESVARLRGDQLTLGYGSYTVAKNLNVSIPDGHFTAIIGPNGCGKSTLLRTLSRLMTPVDGHVWLDGEQIQRYASKEVARRIGLLAQNATTPGDITVQELVARGRLSASAVIYPLAQGRCRRRRQCHACNRYHLTGDAKRRYSVRRPTSAGVDSHGTGAGNVHHAAG
ncbi:ferric enterobactin transport ATP-binding protein FepC [Salmonella enterica subsp. enterica serovar Daytona]|uniref:Ferric enterobactin transport ATP-binding protein FepC n=1 Tax=Salmonella enterica subsp. enterica serovar Daytona TaxID=1962639 RepID=A0A447JLK8_SALET|nr:ferric enterobactin transport ATP-binding protein FepC [Salmonella enterica subsp. enterica serovar Daytona]